MKRTKDMTCACCGGSAGKYKQHHNQDKGYGLCLKCYDWIKGRGESVAQMRRTYGKPGLHHEARAFKHYAKEYTIIADFPDTEDGRVDANRYMAEFQDAAVLGVADDRIVLADVVPTKAPQ